MAFLVKATQKRRKLKYLNLKKVKVSERIIPIMVTNGLKNKRKTHQKEQKKDLKRKKKKISISASKAKGRILQQEIAKRVSELINVSWGPDELIRSREGSQNETDIVLSGLAQELFKYSVDCKRS